MYFQSNTHTKNAGNENEMEVIYNGSILLHNKKSILQNRHSS